MHNIILTTGDHDGIGFEVAAKALLKIGPKKNLRFFLYLSHKKENLFLLSKLKKIFHWAEFGSLSIDVSPLINLVLITSNKNPALWVESAARFCLKNSDFAITTGPLSKPLIKKAARADIGHTEILKRVCKTKDVFMGFVGKKFSVVLATDHIPLRSIEKHLTGGRIKKAFAAAKKLPVKNKKAKIYFLGLNPHSGDYGIIGNFEQRRLNSISKKLTHCLPLVPDIAFQMDTGTKYKIFIALYHDQGLIPFKLIHQHSGVHISLGLPIIRTSVDHGTAKDIYGKNIANFKSMQQAILLAYELLKHGGTNV